MTKGYLLFIMACRAIIALIALFGLSRSHELGTSPFLLASGALIGIFTATRLVSSPLRFRGFVLLYIGGYGALTWVFWMLQTFIPNLTSEIFAVANLQGDFELTYLVFTLFSLTTWLVVRVPGALTVELVGTLLGYVVLFSGHRNFHFESPRILNSMAWSFSTSPLIIITILGILGLFVFVLYARLVSLFNAHVTQRSIPLRGKFALGSTLSVLAILAGLVWLAASTLYNHFNFVQQTRTANGVGQTQSPGLSPLGFHSALGSTAQPSALVRLESDYEKNPFVPMMYLRESALSTFNGRELVMAERIYDQDLPAITPEQNFSADPDAALPERKQISIAAYLLAEHNNAFAIDYPISITPLKNPNPQRFKKAFRAVSLAPQFSLQDLKHEQVGDARWNKAVWDHYLQTTTDKRYFEMAERITFSSNAVTSIERAFALTNYLSENATYTLTPGHEVSNTEDPVAPFLFGDMRGYCVHFAHATVFMLRALGIPSRIGTGYLTDLSQAKDGHILLRMSDRHAWAEVYIAGKGWIPFDTKPKHVESHAETQVDMKLLEELMGMLGPDETVLPKDIAKDEKGLEEPSSIPEFDPSSALPYLLALFALMYLTKLYLLVAWMLPGSASSRIRRTYRALVSWYCDLGYRRQLAESRDEFQKRLSDEIGVNALQVTPLLLKLRYKGAVTPEDSKLLSTFLKEEKNNHRNIHWLRRFIGVFNPISVFMSMRGGAW